MDHGPDTPLSELEAEIVQRVAYGGTTREIARDLDISAEEVKSHLERIFKKLGANDRGPSDAA